MILLHHGLGSVQAWQEQIPALLQAGCRVMVYDRWGYGRSSPRPALDLPTFAADVADLRALLRQLDIPTPRWSGTRMAAPWRCITPPSTPSRCAAW